MPERPVRGRLLGGVCLGIGERFGLDPTLVRLAFLVLVFAWGVGLLLYGGLWLVMPQEGGRVGGRLRDTARENLYTARSELSATTTRMSSAWERRGEQRWPRPLDRRWIAVTLIVAGALVLMTSLGAFAWLTPGRAFGIAAIVFGAAALAGMRSGD